MNTAIIAEVENISLQRDSFGPLMAVFEGQDLNRFRAFCPNTTSFLMDTKPIIGEIVKITVSRIEPGQTVERHKDQLGAGIQRFHVPITAPVHWWDEEDGDMVFPVGSWFGPVLVTLLHSVSNPTPVPRITLIIDVRTA